MMLLDLACFDCVMEKIKSGIFNKENEDSVLVPFAEVNDNGIYEVNCIKGHKSKAIIDNINFEILFEYGLNAIADGYYREGVSTLTVSLERYYEFFLKVILKSSNIDFENIEKIWKHVSSQSERQIGAYIFLYCQTFGNEPVLLNSNKEVSFRNSVIHKGYIPTRQEAINYGDTILRIIERSLINLKKKYPEYTIETFKNYGYLKAAKEKFDTIAEKTGIEQNYIIVNIMTTIDVVHGRELNENDGRKGNVEDRLKSILDRRIPMALTMIKGKSET
jgi:hypothetical protein